MQTLAHLAMLAWFWPFGGGAADSAATIESLEKRSVEIPAAEPLPDGREAAMANYREFLEMASDDPLLRAEAMRRLADLELQSSEDRQSEGDAVALDQTEIENAVEMYQALLDAYPDYEQSDRVLYQLARAYESTGQGDEALVALGRLIAEYPDSPYTDEAEFRRGEILFVDKRYAESERAYASVIATGEESRFFEQSLYKQGWAFFKQGMYTESAGDFLSLLDRRLAPLARDDGSFDLSELARAERELIDDTLRVLSLSYSYVDGQSSIAPSLAGHREDVYGFLLYQSLGDLYLSKERFHDAADTYRAFVARAPLHGSAPAFQLRVIEAYSQGGFPSLVLEGKQTFVEEYGLDREYWQRHSIDSQPETVAALKTNLMDLAQHFHALAQKGQQNDDYSRAVKYYRMHIAYFPEDPDSANTNFLLAELLFESGRYLEAVEEYERTAYAYQPHPKAAEAGYAALVSYQKVEERLTDTEREDWHRRSIESSLRFAGQFTEHPEAMAVLTKASEDLFDLHELDLSIAVADQVIDFGRASDDQLQVVWTVKAHALFDLHKFSDAELAYLQLLSLTPADDAKHAEITERIAASVYKQGELRRAEGDMAGAAIDFLRVAQVAPGASIVATAEYDAAAAFLAAREWQAAIPVLERFRRDYPDNEFAFEATRSLALAYRESGQGVAAADEYVKIAASGDAGSEMQQQSLLEAADLYRAAADPRESDTLESYVEKFPWPLEEALTARERLAQLAGNAGDRDTRMRWLESIVAADADAGGERSVRSRTLAAHASLELAEPSFQVFEGIKLVAPLKQSIKLKKAAMEQALAAYGKATDYGIAEITTAATFHIGEVYFQFSRDLFDSERPADMTADEADQYDLLLEEQAFPFEEQAIEIHQVNAQRTSNGVYDQWVIKSFERLAELMPARYAKAEMGVQAVEEIN